MKISDRQNRELMLFLTWIEAFERREITLRSLIDNLEAVIASREGDDEEWLDAFQKAWSILEEVYSVALDREIEDLNQHANGNVTQALSEMKALAKQKLIPLNDH